MQLFSGVFLIGYAYPQDSKLFYEKSLESQYKRGTIPTWVNFLTSGSDVQGNRIETTLMGWGFRGRHMVVDHYVFMLDKDEDIESLDNQLCLIGHCSKKYRKEALKNIITARIYQSLNVDPSTLSNVFIGRCVGVMWRWYYND